ncbi:hypothetical protein GCM10023318_35990 [Nocardia callitridis]|uniref:FAD-binding domain-containing protein n=1 Tax=Nocardia callitridis TaxID=648753 RepID=A0ABP9KJT4_9NOCA
MLAGALARDGMAVTVFESRPAVRAGAFLFLDDRGHDALEGLGVARDRLYAASQPVSTIRVEYAPGPVRSRPSNHRMYLRADLMGVLTEFAASTPAEFHYDTPIADLDLESRTLCGDSTRFAADELIIAADGIDSRARNHLEPERTPEYAGQVVVYGRTDKPLQPDTEPSVLHFNGQIDETVSPTPAFGHIWNDSISVWFARITREQLAAADIGIQPVAPWVGAVESTAPAISDTIDLLLANTETAHFSNARNVPFARAEPPHPGLILCGDADHAITPAAGVGARDAIEDAAALHRALREGTSPTEAMAARRQQIDAERRQATPPGRSRRS